MTSRRQPPARARRRRRRCANPPLRRPGRNLLPRSPSGPTGGALRSHSCGSPNPPPATATTVIGSVGGSTRTLNRCDTRCEVLLREFRRDLDDLPVGGWLSVYDGVRTAESSELDVDHTVALAEAWISGADRWDDARRRDFANDLTPGALRAVTASVNRSKSDRDPAEWQPPDRSSWCTFADRLGEHQAPLGPVRGPPGVHHAHDDAGELPVTVAARVRSRRSVPGGAARAVAVPASVHPRPPRPRSGRRRCGTRPPGRARRRVRAPWWCRAAR